MQGTQYRFTVFKPDRFRLCDCDFPDICVYSHELICIAPDTPLVKYLESDSWDATLQFFLQDPRNLMIWDGQSKRRMFTVIFASIEDGIARCALVKDCLPVFEKICRFLIPLYEVVCDLGSLDKFPVEVMSGSDTGLGVLNNRKRKETDISMKVSKRGKES